MINLDGGNVVAMSLPHSLNYISQVLAIKHFNCSAVSVFWCEAEHLPSSFTVFTRCRIYSFIHPHVCSSVHSFILLLPCVRYVKCVPCGWLQSNIHFKLTRLINSLIHSSTRSVVRLSAASASSQSALFKFFSLWSVQVSTMNIKLTSKRIALLWGHSHTHTHIYGTPPFPVSASNWMKSLDHMSNYKSKGTVPSYQLRTSHV